MRSQGIGIAVLPQGVRHQGALCLLQSSGEPFARESGWALTATCSG